MNEDKADTPKAHDYRDHTRRFGHDYNFDPVNGGRMAKINGWGDGIEEGDFLVLSHPDGGLASYQIDSIKYARDPKDQWFARATWRPGVVGVNAKTGEIESRPPPH